MDTHLKRDTFQILFRLARSQPWLENKEEELTQLLFEECQNESQKELIISLLNNFEYVSQKKYSDLVSLLAARITGDLGLDDASTQIVAMAADATADSSQCFLYGLKIAIGSTTWKAHSLVNRFGASFKEFRENRNRVNWISHFENHGVSRGLSSQYLPFVSRFLEKNIPPIFELEHLSQLLNVRTNELRKMIAAPASFYRSFEIPKRRGEKRKIRAPYPSILNCQRWIAKNILLPLPTHSAAHGFCLGKSILSNASHHLASEVLLKVDLKDFFPSLPFNWVMRLFLDLGYPGNVSFYKH